MHMLPLFKKKEPVVTTLYRNECCGLCDEAKAVLAKVSPRWNLKIEEVDILSDTRLFLNYQNDVPVAVLNGRELFRHRITEAELNQRLKALLG